MQVIQFLKQHDLHCPFETPLHDKNEDTFIVVLILVWFQLGPYNQQILSVIISAWWKAITSYNLDIFKQQQPPAQLYSMPNSFDL